MTCLTCGGPLEATATTCPACGEPVVSTDDAGATRTDASSAATSGSSPGAGGSSPGTGGPGGGGQYPGGGGQYPGGGGQYPGGGGQYPGGGGVPPGAGGVPPGGWGAQPPHPSGLSSEVRGWGIGAHLAGLIAAFASGAVLGFLGPLLVWLLKREEHPFIDHHGKEALNFQITVLVAIAVGAVLTVPAVIVGVVTFGLGLIVLALVALAAMVLWIVFPIVGAVKAANGEGYRYPLTIRFIR